MSGLASVAMVTVRAWRSPPERRKAGVVQAPLEPHAQGLQRSGELPAPPVGESQGERAPRALGGEGQVLGDRHRRRRAGEGILHDSADPSRAPVGRSRGQVLSSDEDPSRRRDEDSGNDVQQGALACAVRSDDGQEVGSVQVEVDPVKRDDQVLAGAENLADPLQRQHGVQPRSAWSPAELADTGRHPVEFTRLDLEVKGQSGTR